MQLLVQWSRAIAPDWEELDAADWPKAFGEPCCLMCQGVRFYGFDCYHVEPYQGDGLTITVWNPGEKTAAVWNFLPIAPDPNFGGAMNTRQTCLRYGPHNWEFFIAPTEHVRFGKMLPDKLFAEHLAKAKPRSWREIAPGVMIPDQRASGKFLKSRHTRTWYQTPVSSTGHANIGAENQVAFKTVPTGPTTIFSKTISAGGFTQIAAFITDEGQPNSADWPNGTYRIQIDCTTADSLINYGLIEVLGPVDGGFGRTETGGVAAERWSQSEGVFTGTGLMLATRNFNPAAGDVSDRFEVCINAENTSAMVSQDFAIRVGTADGFVDGPWPNLLVSGGGSSGNAHIPHEVVEVVSYA